MALRKFRMQILMRLFLILLLSAGTTFFVLETEYNYLGMITGLLLFGSVFVFTRYLERSKKDLYQFLLSFDKGDFRTKGTSRMLQHSKDDLNYAYHKLLHSIQEYIDEKTILLEHFKNMIDQVHTGLICFDQNWDILFINRGAKNLLHNPDLKNMEGIERIHPAMAEYIRTQPSGTDRLVRLVFDREPSDFFIFATDFTSGGNNCRVVTVRNLKKELTSLEIQSIGRLLVTLEKRKLSHAEFTDSVTEYLQTKMISDLKKKKVLIRDLFDEVCGNFELRKSGDLVCESHLSNPDLWIMADRKALIVVIRSLLDNAAEALSGTKGARIELRAELDLSCNLQITVNDNGPGIEPDIAGYIFIPFFTTREGHAGLGLSIASRIMNSMNGSLDFRSEPGKWTEFILKF